MSTQFQEKADLVNTIENIFPGNISEVVWNNYTKSEVDRYELFSTSFFIQSLFFGKLIIPIKSILNHPLYYSLIMNNKIDNIRKLIQPISLHSSDHRISTAKRELIQRGDLILEKSKINKLASYLSEMQKDVKECDKTDFHRTYHHNLCQVFSSINNYALIINNKTLIQSGSLLKEISEMSRWDDLEWTEEKYFGSRTATSIIEKHKTGNELKILNDAVYATWDLTFQNYLNIYVSQTPEYLVIRNIVKDILENGRPNYNITNEKLTREYERLLFPIPIIPLSIDFEVISLFKEEKWFEEYSNLVSLARNISNRETEINEVKIIYRKYKDTLDIIISDARGRWDKASMEKSINNYNDKLKILRQIAGDEIVKAGFSIFIGQSISGIRILFSAAKKIIQEKFGELFSSKPVDYFKEVYTQPCMFNPVTGDVEKIR
ncbi:MAG: hypothetical protein ABSF88_09215 [Candidatus Aminicenantales bacterium]